MRPALQLPRSYAGFRGRAARREFWPFVLVTMAALLTSFATLPPLGALLLLGTALPVAALSVRRMHDLDLSGTWLLPLVVLPGLMLVTLLAGNSLFTLLILAAIDPGLSAGDVEDAAVTIMTALGWSFGFCALAAAGMLLRRGTRGPNRFGDDPRLPA